MSTTWLPAHCGCGCRPVSACAPGCPCPECQPGPGIDYRPLHYNVTAAKRARMNVLLAELDRRPLSDSEDAELDQLIEIYLRGPRPVER